MDEKSHALAHKMLHAAGEQLVPLEVANAALGILCLALSKMDDVQRRDKLVAGVEAAVRSGVANLLLAAETGKAETPWLQ